MGGGVRMAGFGLASDANCKSRCAKTAARSESPLGIGQGHLKVICYTAIGHPSSSWALVSFRPLAPRGKKNCIENVVWRPENVEKVNGQKADAEHDDNGYQHLSDFASRQHLTASIPDYTACRVAGWCVVQTTWRRRGHVIWNNTTRQPATFSHRGLIGLEANIFGLGLVGSWPRSRVLWPHGLTSCM